MEWCPARWSVCLPLLIFPCTMKSRSSLLAAAHPGGPGKRAVKQLWVCVCVFVSQYLALHCCMPAFITFRVSRRRHEMYIGHMHLCVCVCVCLYLSLAIFPHYCTDPDVTWTNGRECPLIVHCWADLQSLHWFRCYDNIHVCNTLQMHVAACVCVSVCPSQHANTTAWTRM